MAELHIDAAVANRFISSLSKSLQALCHGCMDFESGLEIGGHIYIKIDCESKVDYVLDEKVEKTNDNSMKFVSNSFLAKKEKVKHTQDGSCSPVQELQTPPPPLSQNYQQGSAYQYSSGHHQSQRPATHSNVSSGSRASLKRHIFGTDNSRGFHTQGKRSYQRQSQSGYSSLSQTFPSQRLSQDQNSFEATSSHNPGSRSYDYKHNENNDINVKKEAFEGEEGLGPLEDSGNAALETFNIKTDPDGGLGSTDLTGQNTQQCQQSCELNSLSASGTLKEESSDNNTFKAGETVTNTDPQVSEQLGPGSAYPESSQGDNSGLGGDFDVIEIDEDDEDMGVMFGADTNRKAEFELSMEKTKRKQLSINSLGLIQCQICSSSLAHELDWKNHMSLHHGDHLPFKCNLCTKGYFSKSGLESHIQDHKGNVFQCPICDKITSRKFSLNRHLRKVHRSAQCSSCMEVYHEALSKNHICKS